MSYIGQSLTLSLAFTVAAFAGDGPTKKRHNAALESAESAQSGVLWVAPADLESRNLFLGSGGEGRAPHVHRGQDLIGPGALLEWIQSRDPLERALAASPKVSSRWMPGRMTPNCHLQSPFPLNSPWLS